MTTLLDRIAPYGNLVSRLIPVAAPILLLHTPMTSNNFASDVFFKVYCVTSIVILLLPALMAVSLRTSAEKHLKERSKVKAILDVVILLLGGFILIGSVQVFFTSMSQTMFMCFLGMLTLIAFNERYVYTADHGFALSLYFFTMFYEAFLLFLLLRFQSYRPGILYCLAIAAVCTAWPLSKRILSSHINTVEESIKDIPDEDPVAVAKRKKSKKKKKKRQESKKGEEPLTRWEKKILKGPRLPVDQLLRRSYAVLITLGPLTIGMMACIQMLPPAYVSLLAVPVLFSRPLIEPLSLSEDSSPLPSYFLAKTTLYLLSYLLLLAAVGTLF